MSIINLKGVNFMIKYIFESNYNIVLRIHI